MIRYLAGTPPITVLPRPVLSASLINSAGSYFGILLDPLIGLHSFFTTNLASILLVLSTMETEDGNLSCEVANGVL